MDRRTSIATLLGRSAQKQAATMTASPQKIQTSGMDPYQGPWEFEQAAHLLRRATFGPNNVEIKQAVQDGLEATLDKLFASLPLPNPPVNFNYADDPAVPIGETWIDAPYTLNNIQAIQQYRNQSFRGWAMGLLLNEGTSIREKMVLFWHNHFVTANINDPKFGFHQFNLYRTNPWGNFRQLTKDVTVAPSMLRYLNGNQNAAQAPNENYARELLELFTIGKGPTVGNGDYTNYTEEDIIEIARILTGWVDRGFNTLNPNTSVSSTFRPFLHDNGDKQLSHRFDEVVISNMGEDEYAHLIDIIFQKEEVAHFICRKLYRWFIYYDITEEVEINVIEPMAAILLENDYEIKPALIALLQSEHFFDILNVGPMIKNPIDFVMSATKQLEIPLPTTTNLIQYYNVNVQYARILPEMQMDYFNPPSVAGWKAYYQAPTFYRQWISAATLPLRMDITNLLTGNGFMNAGFLVRMQPLTLVESFENPSDPNELIKELGNIIFPQPITQNQIDALKEILIPGLPDFEWTVEYADYLNNPNDQALAASVENKLRNLIQSMLTMPEFYLS